MTIFIIYVYGVCGCMRICHAIAQKQILGQHLGVNPLLPLCVSWGGTLGWTASTCTCWAISSALYLIFNPICSKTSMCLTERNAIAYSHLKAGDAFTDVRVAYWEQFWSSNFRTTHMNFKELVNEIQMQITRMELLFFRQRNTLSLMNMKDKWTLDFFWGHLQSNKSHHSRLVMWGK